MSSRSHILTFITIFLLSHLLSFRVTAHPQYPGWGGFGAPFGGGNNDPDDDDRPNPWYLPSSTPAPRTTEQPPRQTNPWQPWGPGPYSNPQPWVPGGNPRPSPGSPTITITRTTSWNPNATPPPQQFGPATSTRTWTAPSAWGPPRSPFGPSTQTASGPQTIPTTTTELPKAPVPFITICGGTRYIEEDVSNALISGCYYKNKTTTVSKSGYPKAFSNPQNFNFGDIQGGLWEFPLISSAGYVGGDPGPDRVIFNTACYLAGELTQNGAGQKGFVECREQY